MFEARAPLLCIRCGEALGEAREGNCLRCGLPISASVAAVGSPATAEPPGYPMPPLARKRRVGLIIGIVAALVAVVATSIGAALAFASRSGASVPAHVRAVGTPTATPHETVLLTDPMTAPIHRWLNDDSHCSFQSDGYHIAASYFCFAPTQQLENVSFTAQVRQVRGELRWFYGLVFRRAANGDYYSFEIAGAGFWRFGKVVNNQYHDIRPSTRADAVLTGAGPINTLTVWAIGTHFTFFVNSIEVGQADDNTYSFGYVGVEGNAHIEVVYTNVDVGLLSLPPQ